MTDKKQLIIDLFLSGRTQQSIGDELGCSRGYVSEVLLKNGIHSAMGGKAVQPRICKFGGCEKTIHAKGYCNNHYRKYYDMKKAIKDGRP